MFEELKDKSVLITGSTTGIGAAIAKQFGRLGARVVIHGHVKTKNQAVEACESIKKQGGEAIILLGDATITEEVEQIVHKTASQFGTIDILINNVGSMVKRVSVEETNDTIFNQVVDLNARSMVSATRVAVPYFKKQGHGIIINTSSAAARSGGAGGAGLYAAAKAFVENYTRNQAKELAEFNIRVNAVAPGIIMTAFQEQFSTPEKLEAARKTIPLGRLGSPEDCVGAYLFLACNKLSSYITGQVIAINGGRFMT